MVSVAMLELEGEGLRRRTFNDCLPEVSPYRPSRHAPLTWEPLDFGLIHSRRLMLPAQRVAAKGLLLPWSHAAFRSSPTDLEYLHTGLGTC